jgi:hypothetical protein
MEDVAALTTTLQQQINNEQTLLILFSYVRPFQVPQSTLCVLLNDKRE